MLGVESKQATMLNAAMIGFESVGKSAIFRQLTGDHRSVARNVKGSTISAREAQTIANTSIRLTDLPGIQVEGDSMTTKLALSYTKEASWSEVILVVVMSTRLRTELLNLYKQVSLKGKRVAIVVTYADKYEPKPFEQKRIKALLGVPVTWVNARHLTSEMQDNVMNCIKQSAIWGATASVLTFLPDQLSNNEPQKLLFLQEPIIGSLIALLIIMLIFAVPVYLSYLFVVWLEPLVELYALEPIAKLFEGTAEWWAVLMVGDYGLLTLGSYSFIWAFPVVLLMSVMTVITEETGLQEHLTSSLDPWMRKMGLTGRDLLPVLTGFGCNVVAVMQSRSCSQCTRASCVSLISFGSACSYQIGATLSIFNAVGAPLLFLPYISLLCLVGAIHTKIWSGTQEHDLNRVAPLPPLQGIDKRAMAWKVSEVIKQFLFQAMPIFLIICVVAAFLELFNVLTWVSQLISPILSIFSLPGEVAPGLVFSFLRKDGLMILNQGQGMMLSHLSINQVFLLVYLASTLSACLVTIVSVGRELNWRTAGSMMIKQFVTSIVSTGLLALLFLWI